jgi:hypothetical protein
MSPGDGAQQDVEEILVTTTVVLVSLKRTDELISH